VRDNAGRYGEANLTVMTTPLTMFLTESQMTQ
jgi:hypothetical protein